MGYTRRGLRTLCPATTQNGIENTYEVAADTQATALKVANP